MPEISQFTVPVTENGVTKNVTYDFKDSTARSSSGGKGASGKGANAEIFNDYINNTATGEYSHAEGIRTAAWGKSSHAEGYLTRASAGSHAEGICTIASDEYDYETTNTIGAHAEGWHTEARSFGAHAEGCYTYARSGGSEKPQHVQGIYNVKDTAGTYAFIIGNGTGEDSRHNAFAVDWNGLIYVNGSSTGVDVSALPTSADVNSKLNSSAVDSSGSSGTSGWYNCRLYNGKIQYYNTDTNTTYSTTSSVTSGSSALVTSGGVYSALQGTSVTVSSSYGTINRQGVKRVGNIVIGTCQLTLTASVSGKVDLITGLPSPSAVRDAIPFKKSNTFRTDDCWITTAGQYRVQIATGNALSSGDVLNFIFAYVI